MARWCYVLLLLCEVLTAIAVEPPESNLELWPGQVSAGGVAGNIISATHVFSAVPTASTAVIDGITLEFRNGDIIRVSSVPSSIVGSDIFTTVPIETVWMLQEGTWYPIGYNLNAIMSLVVEALTSTETSQEAFFSGETFTIRYIVQSDAPYITVPLSGIPDGYKAEAVIYGDMIDARVNLTDCYFINRNGAFGDRTHVVINPTGHYFFAGQEIYLVLSITISAETVTMPGVGLHFGFGAASPFSQEMAVLPQFYYSGLFGN